MMRRKTDILTVILIGAMTALMSCSARKAADTDSAVATESRTVNAPVFNADSAYSYVKRQVDFGPRVPNTEAHRLCGDWLVEKLRSHGAEVTEQKADLKAFDGTVLHARNIFGRYNPDAERRILLLAHWDCRPWADADPDPANHKSPVDGANDGASGTGVLLETARLLGQKAPELGVDILFVDAEDWGTEGDDASWALGAKYFVENPPVENYFPEFAILLDMVGGKDAIFCREYFSQEAAPSVADSFWATASEAGFDAYFKNTLGGAVTDDHVKLIDAGIPAIDIIEYHPQSGFNPRWHTVADNMDGISAETLKAVGQTLVEFIYH